MQVLACDRCKQQFLETEMYCVAQQDSTSSGWQPVRGFTVLRRGTDLQMSQPYEVLCRECTKAALEQYLG